MLNFILITSCFGFSFAVSVCRDFFDGEESVIEDISGKVGTQMSPMEVRRKCGFFYDDSLEEHWCAWDPLHIENPNRIRNIKKRLEELSTDPLRNCIQLKPRKCRDEELLLVHDTDLIETVKKISSSDGGINFVKHKAFSEKYNAVYLNQATFDCALLAAGSAIDLVEKVYEGSLDNGFAVIRPPGHHASSHQSNGFCIFNNVAIAAKNLLQNHQAKRILILDWDVHHGQGTQKSFFDDDRVLFVSIHQYDEGIEWPSLREGNFDAIGEGAGKGFNVNVPLNGKGLKDEDYLAIFCQLILPIAFEFNPEIVIVSAGYDAAIGCPEGHMMLSPAAYGHLTHMLSSLAGGKLAIILEGGYCLDSLAEGAACTLEALLGIPPQPLLPLAQPNPLVVTSILNAISVLRSHWKCLRFQEREAVEKFNSKITHHTPRIKFEGPTEPYPNECYLHTPFYSPAETVELRHQIGALKEQYDAFRQSLTYLNRTGYVYDEMMLGHAQGLCGHPEVPERISAIYRHLDQCGLLAECLAIPIREAEKEELGLVHSTGYVEKLVLKDQLFSEMTERMLSKGKWSADMQATEGSGAAVRCAAGSLLNLVDAVLDGKCLNGLAIIRPPGHHAHHDEPAGFCFANNVAVAAKYALAQRDLSRILIVDWDVHHGDGVQELFYEDPRVLYISLHRGEIDFFPQGQGKFAKRKGKGEGMGFNINIAWSQSGRTDGDYLAAFLQLILPVAYQFAPELVLVCCGLDAALGDPLGQCRVTETGYGIMTHMLMALAGGKVVVALEGGYNLKVIPRCMESVCRALMGFPLVIPSSPLLPSKIGITDMKAVIDVHSNGEKAWSSLQFHVLLMDPVDETAGISQPEDTLRTTPPKEKILLNQHHQSSLIPSTDAKDSSAGLRRSPRLAEKEAKAKTTEKSTDLVENLIGGLEALRLDRSTPTSDKT